MVYESEAVRQSQRVFAWLLERRRLRSEDDRELSQAYAASQEVRDLVRAQAEALRATVVEYQYAVYLIPDIGNTFLGYTKTELKNRLCRSGATEADYALVQFVILILLISFYDGEGVTTSRTRNYLLVDDLQNEISTYLRIGAENLSRDSQKEEGISFSDMRDVYEALTSDTGKARTKTTKEGFLHGILRFLEDQGLITYVISDGQIYTTEMLDAFMDNNLLNRDHYFRVNQVLNSLEGEKNQ